MRARTLHLATLALVLNLAAPIALPAAEAAKPGEPFKNKLGMTQYVMKNGMEVVIIENHGLPLVSIELCAKNGAYTETPDFNGLSHLYEHMFFKSNAKIPSQEKYMERLRELGAQWNGTTGDERVNYFMTIHKKNLREGVEFLRDALLYPLFKEEELRKEWPVVLGEFDRNEASPMFHLSREMDRLMWWKHYSRKNPIGDRDVIFNATREQMKEIQRRYYVPNNCAIFIAGDVNPEEGIDLAEEMFGAWPRGEDPHKKWPVPQHPPLEKTSRVAVTGPVKTATIQIQYHGPSLKKDNPATYAADVLSNVLGQPDSNFQKALVDTGLVDGVGFSYYSQLTTGPISIGASTSADRLDKAWEAINVELGKLTDPAYITEEQIASAKNAIEIDDIRSREQTSSFIHSASYWWATGGLDYYADYLENIKKVTRKDLIDFVRKYMEGKHRVEGVLVGPDEVDGLEFAKTATRINPKSGSSAVAFEKKAEPKGAVTTEEFDVDGLKVVLRSNPANEIVVAQMALLGGLQFSGAANAGRELVLLEAIDKGSAKFTKEEVNRRLAATGSALGAEARNDYSVFSLSTLKRDFDGNFAIFADALARPLLTEEEVRLGVERRLNGIRQMQESPDAYISILTQRNFFKGHPYENPASGIEEAVKPLTAEALKKLHADTFVRSRMKLFVVGDVTKEKLTEMVRAGFEGVPAGDYKAAPKMRDASQKPALLTEKRDLPTNYIMGAFQAPSLSDPDYYPLQVAVSILDDRLFNEVRTKRNLSYAVAAQISSRLSNYGVFYVTAVRPNETLQVMLAEADKMSSAPVSEKELKDKVEEIITGDLVRKQTNATQAASLLLYDMIGPGWQAEAEAVEKLSAVTLPEIQRVSAKYLKGISFSLLGDPTQADEKLFTSK